MEDQANTLEFIGQVTMKWLEDCAVNPKNGSYMEAVADLTGRIIGGAVEAAGYGPKEDPGSAWSGPQSASQ